MALVQTVEFMPLEMLAVLMKLKLVHKFVTKNHP